MSARIIHPALVMLIRMNIRSKFRRLRSAFRTPKGIIASVFALGVFALFMGPTLVMVLVGSRSDPAIARSSIPIGLLLYCLLNLIFTKHDTGIAFLPAEVDFLFPAPFRRSELLLYKIAGVAITSSCMALFISAFLIRHISLWIAGLIGIALALMLIQLCQIGVSLLASTVKEKVYTRGRKVVLFGLAAVVLSGIVTTVSDAGDADFLTVVTRFRESWIGLAVLAPFEVFGRTICAETLFPEFVTWGAIAAAIVLLVLVIVVRLDANFLETSAAASQKRYEIIQRARRGNPWAAMKQSSSRLRIPQLPWWGGAGPIAWRQMCTALRASRGFAIVMILVGVSAAIPMIVLGSNWLPSTSHLIGIIVGVSILYLPMMLRFDFRGDVDHFDVLKTLPVSPTAMVIGQLATPIVFSVFLQLLCFTGIAILQQELSATLLIAIAFLLPANLLVYALENLVFLFFPYRITVADFQAQGRQFMIMFLKMMVLFLLAGISAGAGGLAYLVSDGSWTAFLVVTWIVVTLLSISSLPLLCWGYRRIDPSVDIPF